MSIDTASIGPHCQNDIYIAVCNYIPARSMFRTSEALLRYLKFTTTSESEKLPRSFRALGHSSIFHGAQFSFQRSKIGGCPKKIHGLVFEENVCIDFTTHRTVFYIIKQVHALSVMRPLLISSIQVRRSNNITGPIKNLHSCVQSCIASES